MSSILILILAAAAAIAPVWVVVAIRATVRRQRQEVIRDLAAVFRAEDDADDLVFPSFEFVKYKYYLSRPNEKDKSEFASDPARKTKIKDEGVEKDFTKRSWVAGALPLVFVVFFLNIFTFFTIAVAAISLPVAGFDLGTALQVSTMKSAWITSLVERRVPIWTWAVIAAYAGAYLFMMRAFFRAINNFDLSPASFVGALANLLFGVVVALVTWAAIQAGSQLVAPDAAGGPSDIVKGIGIWAVVGTSFVVGFFPDVALRNLVSSSRLKDYKREDSGVFQAFVVTPIEVIDGIDSEIRDRLGDFHIVSVQNLAATNPIMLFVETPYGVYQIMDWVAQAQLCSSVGSKALIKLWSIGVRTIFDLERMANDPQCRSPELLQIIGRIICVPESDVTLSEAAIVNNIRLRLEEPHVHRLRQIYIRVRENLGSHNRRLPPIADCPPQPDQCPFVVPKMQKAA